MRSGNGSIDVVLADASTLTLDASASKWTGRAPLDLAKRGDLVRVRRIETPVKKKAGSDDTGGDDDAGGETAAEEDRKSVGEGKGVSVRVDLGGRGLIEKKKTKKKSQK